MIDRRIAAEHASELNAKISGDMVSFDYLTFIGIVISRMIVLIDQILHVVCILAERNSKYSTPSLIESDVVVIIFQRLHILFRKI